MTKRLIRQPRRNVLSIRSILVLFLSTLTLSLIILSVIFNVVFKNIDMSFNTRIPESAPVPDAAEEEDTGETENLSRHNGPFKAKFIQHDVYTASLNVPGASSYTPRVSEPVAETVAPLPTIPTLQTSDGIPVPSPLPKPISNLPVLDPPSAPPEPSQPMPQ